MKLAAVASLPLKAETGTWYRAVDPRFLPTALQTTHTTAIFSRYSPGPSGQPPFEILYLAENHLVAMFEVGALFGNPTQPGGVVPKPGRSWVVASVTVRLAAVVDLTQALAQQVLQVSAQELTGDWAGYQSRSPGTSVSQPIGLSPTQRLGEALKQDARNIEGFVSLSARLPYHLSLMIFPQNLHRGSSVRFGYEDAAGQTQSFTIP